VVIYIQRSMEHLSFYKHMLYNTSRSMIPD